MKFLCKDSKVHVYMINNNNNLDLWSAIIQKTCSKAL